LCNDENGNILGYVSVKYVMWDTVGKLREIRHLGEALAIALRNIYVLR